MRRSLLLSVASVALLTGLAHAQTIQITQSITTNETWGPTGTTVGDIFWVRNSIAVSANAILEIEPGVVVKFDPGSVLIVNGRLRAAGTSGSNIFFTSIKDDNAGFFDDTNGDGNLSAPAPSDWAGISFPSASADSSLISYCDIRYAGYGQRGALFFASATDSVVNSTIRSSYYGVECQGTASPVLSATRIEASTLTPVTLDFTASPSLDALVFSSSDNGYDAFGLRGGTLSGSATLPVRGATVGVTPISNVTYVLLSQLSIAVGGSLTVDPGVVIKPLGGGIDVAGNLTMNGTSGSNITITSIRDDTFGNPLDTNNDGSLSAPNDGDWFNIDFADGSTGSIQYCRLKFGAGGLVRMTNENIPISNTLLSDALHGVALMGTSAPTLNTVTIQNSSSTPILMSAAADPTLTNLSFIANAITALGITPENLSVDARLYPRTVAGYANITYVLLNGYLAMGGSATLTIDPGVVLKFQHSGGGAGLSIDGALVADGKPESLIVFTSYRDDLYGNPSDTNGDGSITAPATGDWGYIHYTATSNDATSRLDNCRITYGSYSSTPPTSLWITSAAPTITSCTISKTGYGVLMDGGAAPTIDQCSITNCNGAPFAMSVLADPTLTNNTFATNAYNAIALLSETLAQDATLEYRPGVGSPPFAYMPLGQITVGSGVTLAIQPRVVIKPLSGGIVFSVDGALNGVGGTGPQRIVLTSIADDAQAGDTNADGSASSPSAGQAGGIQFNNTSIDAACILRNWLIQFGADAINTVSASPRIARVEFFQNASVLVARGTSQPSLDSLTVLNCTSFPFNMSLVSDPQFGGTITLANNAYTAIGILGETHAQDVRLGLRSIAGIPNITYALAGDLAIAFGAKWTIDPGIVLKLGAGGSTIDIHGALVADGKPDSLIVFTSIKDDAFGGDTNNDGALTSPAPGNWYAIRFSAVSDDANTVVDHCRVRYAGGDFLPVAAMWFTNAGPTLTNTTITSSARDAVLIEGNSTPTFTSCAFDSSANAPVRMSLVSEPTFNSVQFLGNAYTALSVVPETIAQDLLWRIRAVAGKQNMPYLVEGALTSGLGSTLTLQPGLIVKFTSAGEIDVLRAFVAEGRTPRDSMIVFTSVHDDFHGGDTDNNGDGAEPIAGSWGGVVVEGTAIDTDVRFRNCVFRYGGGFSGGALKTVNASPSVDSCLFAYNFSGVSAEGVSDPAIHGCSFTGNAAYGIDNRTASFCIDAEGNWWGAASGPDDGSAVSDLCGLGANAGTGDAVSNNVDYDPWLTSGTAVPMLGDVSLNGEVRAFDASLILQYVVSSISLSDLQKLVADVSGTAGITAFDASLILQYVAGTIRAFPAASTLKTPSHGDVLAARQIAKQAQGDFTVALGAARREGDEWLVPVIVAGSAPIYSVELRLTGGAAAALIGVSITAASSAMAQHAIGADGAHAAVAATAVLPAGETLTLHFHATGEWAAPDIAWARVNENEITRGTGADPVPPGVSFLRSPAPNPARSSVTFALGIADRQGGHASVRILDLAGRRVRQVIDRTIAPGVHPLTWDLRNESGGPVPPGIYLVLAEVGGRSFTSRLAVVR